MKSVRFYPPIKEKYFNRKTIEPLFLHSADSYLCFTKKDLGKIIQICNQDLVYKYLFKEKLNNKKYELKHAQEFVNYAVKGWRDQTHFVFFIRNSRDEIVGALDLKSNATSKVEIGYWADANQSGVMTNAVAKLINIAKNAGLISLYATVMPNNDRSKNVLLSNGFVSGGIKIIPNLGVREIYSKELI